MPTHYEALGVSADASSQQLRQAFRALSKRYHPDTTSLPAAQAEAAFQRVRQAYGVLGDPEARRAYDEQLRQPIRPAVVFSPPAVQSGAAFQAKPASVRRSLSGGEWFALVLLAVALVLSLVLGVGLAWARGAELMTRPSWWIDPSVAPAPVRGEPVLSRSEAGISSGEPELFSGEPNLSSGEPVLACGEPVPALRQAP